MPPEAAWPALVKLLGAHGGRTHVAALRAVSTAPGYPSELRGLAKRALERIRARLGPDTAGRVDLAGDEGGELAIAAEPGALAVAEAALAVATAAPEAEPAPPPPEPPGA